MTISGLNSGIYDFKIKIMHFNSARVGAIPIYSILAGGSFISITVIYQNRAAILSINNMKYV